MCNSTYIFILLYTMLIGAEAYVDGITGEGGKPSTKPPVDHGIWPVILQDSILAAEQS